MSSREKEIERKRQIIIDLFRKQKELENAYEYYIEEILANDELILTMDALSLKDWLIQNK